MPTARKRHRLYGGEKRMALKGGMDMHKLTLWGVMVFLCAVGFAAYAQQDLAPEYGGELIYAYTVEPPTLFPLRTINIDCQEIWLYAYENLFELDEQSDVVPWLAKSWEVSEDSLTYTLWLEKNISFSDGTPFNADAVKFVLEENLRVSSPASSLLLGLVDARVVDDYTIELEFEVPIAALIPNLASRSLCMWSPAAYEEHGADWMASNLVGTGPFLLDEWVHGEYVRFVKNGNYWKSGLPYLDAITIRLVPEMSVRMMMLETGEVDRTVGIGDYQLAALQVNPDIRVRIVPSVRQSYVIINNLKHPYDNVLVRRALNYAIDKDAIIQSVYASLGSVPCKMPIISEGVVGFSDMTAPGEDSLYPYDPERASKLLGWAGFADRDDDGILEDVEGNDLRMSLWTRKGRNRGDYETMEMIQTYLINLGILAELRIWEFAAYSAMTSLGPEEAEYELAFMSWGVFTGDADQPMMLNFRTAAWKPASSNRMFSANEEVDRLAEAAHSEVDPDRRRELIRLWAEEVISDAPIIFLPTLSINLASRTYVHDDRILPVENYPARFAWLDSDEMARQGVSR